MATNRSWKSVAPYPKFNPIACNFSTYIGSGFARGMAHGVSNQMLPKVSGNWKRAAAGKRQVMGLWQYLPSNKSKTPLLQPSQLHGKHLDHRDRWPISLPVPRPVVASALFATWAIVVLSTQHHRYDIAYSFDHHDQFAICNFIYMQGCKHIDRYIEI